MVRIYMIKTTKIVFDFAVQGILCTAIIFDIIYLGIYSEVFQMMYVLLFA